MSSHQPVGGHDPRTLQPPTDQEDHAIRNDYDEFVVSIHKQNNGRLHLPGGTGEYAAVCHRLTESDSRVVDTAAYPVGYKQICSHCAAIWREQ